MSAPFRLPTGGLIDRGRPLGFTFDGVAMTGFYGDTVASALLANGVTIVGRSLKGHRPRGVVAAGVEEPNALVSVEGGGFFEPMARATEIPLRDGMRVRSLNAWPNAHIDLAAMMGVGSALTVAGFYYKTFIWPAWSAYEWIVRKAAGLGRLPRRSGPDPSLHAHESIDVLIVGGGPAGIAAAETLAGSGLQVVLAEARERLGGSLSRQSTIAGEAGGDWLRQSEAVLERSGNVAIGRRTMVAGAYAGNLFVLDEKDGEGGHRLYKLSARQVVLATGAIEQPLLFANNDRPGVMLADAVRLYLEDFAVVPGRRGVVVTNSDSAWELVPKLARAGVAVAALVDSRRREACRHAAAIEALGVTPLFEATVTAVRGVGGVRGVSVSRQAHPAETVECDFLAVSGGWLPLLHLAAHRGSRPRYDAEAGTLQLTRWPDGWHACGSVAGSASVEAVLLEGAAAGVAAAAALGRSVRPAYEGRARPRPAIQPPIQPMPRHEAKVWVDLQADVTLRDVRIAAAEGFGAPEHLKRYTTGGMAADQGRTSSLNLLRSLAEVSGRDMAGLGVTTFRPPFAGLNMGAIAGLRRGALHAPVRETPMLAEHLALEAEMGEFGGWRRADHYRSNAPDREKAVSVEMAAVRNAVGVFDGSPLGKVEIAGPDAARFVDRFYVSDMIGLKPGHIRYSLLLREDGIIFDDGVAVRLSEDRFLLSPTSGRADQVLFHLERWRQTEWPDLRVAIASIGSQWATLALSGPASRQLLTALGPDFPVDRESFPHMRFREGRVAGVPARVARVSFTGELQFELSVPARHGAALWRRAMEAGRDLGVRPVGIEAWLRLRVEKGYIHVGVDTDGRTLPDDIGFGAIARKKAADFIGKRSLDLSYANDPDRDQLVGLLAGDGAVLEPGGRILAAGHARPPAPVDGRVTSATMSVAAGGSIALAMLRRGRERLGEVVAIQQGGRQLRARVTEPVFHDPAGARLRA